MAFLQMLKISNVLINQAGPDKNQCKLIPVMLKEEIDFSKGETSQPGFELKVFIRFIQIIHALLEV